MGLYSADSSRVNTNITSCSSLISACDTFVVCNSERMCMPSILDVSEKPGLILDVIDIQKASSEEELTVVVDRTCSRDLVSSLLEEVVCKWHPGADSIALNTCLEATTATSQEMFDLPYETATPVGTAERAPAAENVVGAVTPLTSIESLQISGKEVDSHFILVMFYTV